MSATGRSLLEDCVHCGFCLPVCPTYISWSEEMDSPRGRIDLMRGLAAGESSWTPTVVAHFDKCLGCMACVTACPSGVRYDILIEQTRAKIEDRGVRSLSDRLHRALLFSLLPYPDRLRRLLPLLRLSARSGLQRLLGRAGALRILPRRLAQLAALTPEDLGAEAGDGDLPRRTTPIGAPRACVALVAGCVQRVFFPQVNAATIRVLAAEGCEVRVPQPQGCCGALSIHAGREEEGRAFARSLIESFEGESVNAIIVNAAGCGSNLKDYGRQFADEPNWAARAAQFSSRVRDVNEYLAGLPPSAPRHPLPLRVAYHDACHLAHAQRIRAEPRALLAAIPGLELLEIPAGDQCCGSAGVYNLLESESADEIGARKADNVLSTRPDLLASANPGCTLQIRKILRERGIELPAAHPIEILDASIAGRGIGTSA